MREGRLHALRVGSFLRSSGSFDQCKAAQYGRYRFGLRRLGWLGNDMTYKRPACRFYRRHANYNGTCKPGAPKAKAAKHRGHKATATPSSLQPRGLHRRRAQFRNRSWMFLVSHFRVVWWWRLTDVVAMVGVWERVSRFGFHREMPKSFDCLLGAPNGHSPGMPQDWQMSYSVDGYTGS